MSSVFGNHDRSSFRIFAYSLSPSDGSQYSQKIAAGVDVFRDVSSWPSQYIVEQIVEDEIHIRSCSFWHILSSILQSWSVVNLNGYTKGARNDVFAARPSPLQISFLGFAGTLAAGRISSNLPYNSLALTCNTRLVRLHCLRPSRMPSWYSFLRYL